PLPRARTSDRRESTPAISTAMEASVRTARITRWTFSAIRRADPPPMVVQSPTYPRPALTCMAPHPSHSSLTAVLFVPAYPCFSLPGNRFIPGHQEQVSRRHRWPERQHLSERFL